MKVLKFGGSSVRNATMIRRVVEIAGSVLDDAPVLVASAMGKTTDLLVSIAADAEAGRRESVELKLDRIQSSHLEAAAALCTGSEAGGLSAAIGELLGELRSLVHGIGLIRECSPRSLDAVLSFGERLSTTVIAAATRSAGIETELVDARTLIRTDSAFNAASPDYEVTRSLVGERLKPRPGALVVTQGFIASSPDGVTTTLGRGGSDFSATIIASAADADLVEIWTDVDGIMSADPRIIEGARTIDTISYDEAAELAYFGARVVHPYTILPAVRNQIPVWVKNTTRPDHPGTRIAADSEAAGVRAVASKSGITMITVKSSRMLNAYGFLRAIFAKFDRYRIPVDLVATSEVSVSVTVDSTASLDQLLNDLEELGRIEVSRGVCIVCVVGRELFENPAFVAEVFGAVAPAHVHLISFGSSEINLSFVVAEEDEAPVLQRLHSRLWSG